jgi:hypothetical protein
MSCKVTSSNYTPFVPTEEDPQVVQEYNRKQLEQPMEQLDKQIVFMLDEEDEDHDHPVFNMTREKAEQLISRHKDFIIFIKVDQQAVNDVKYRIRCLKVAWSYKYNKALTGYVFEQNITIPLDIRLEPDYGIKERRVLMSLNIEDAYRISGPYINSDYNVKRYWVGGHGSQVRPYLSQTGYFIVPYNCMIIVKGRSGDVTYIDTTYKYFKTLQTDSYHTSIQNFGSVAIYGPGDKCPEFMYQLNAIYAGDREGYSSGIVDFDCKLPGFSSIINSTIKANADKAKDIKNIEELKSYYLEQYKYSIYPPQNDISLRIDKIINTFPHLFYNTNEMFEKSKAVINANLDTIRITQSRLCELFPGIYYNFVCRDIEDTYQELYKSTSVLNTNKKERRLTSRTNNNTIKEIEHKKKLQNKSFEYGINGIIDIKDFVLKDTISEAIGHRAPFIKNQFALKYENISRKKLKRKDKKNNMNKEISNRIRVNVSNRRAAQQKALENANHAEYNRKTKKNNAQNNRTTLKNGKPTIRPTPIINNNTPVMAIPAAGGRRSTKKKRSS